MKRTAFILLIIVMLMPVAPGIAQNPAAVIDTLDIEMWPDYDRPSVLVLLTGMLPGDTRLPASVTLPIPQGAQINAVARIDAKDGKMKDDILSSTDPAGTLTFVTPDLRFRVEYYLPYTVNDNQRTFDYTWLSDISVNSLQLVVQQPVSASTLITEPATANVTRNRDGLDYHTFPARSVPAGQPFSVHVEYIANSAQLSVANLLPADTGKQTPSATARPRNDAGINWALVAVVAGGLLIFGALIWQVASRRLAGNTRRPVASGGKTQSRAKYCRDCGASIAKDDKFCSGCGSKL